MLQLKVRCFRFNSGWKSNFFSQNSNWTQQRLATMNCQLNCNGLQFCFFQFLPPQNVIKWFFRTNFIGSGKIRTIIGLVERGIEVNPGNRFPAINWPLIKSATTLGEFHLFIWNTTISLSPTPANLSGGGQCWWWTVASNTTMGNSINPRTTSKQGAREFHPKWHQTNAREVAAVIRFKWSSNIMLLREWISLPKITRNFFPR